MQSFSNLLEIGILIISDRRLNEDQSVQYSIMVHGPVTEQFHGLIN